MKKREIWVDWVKVFACFLVVSGHFIQSMIKSSVIAETSLTGWVLQTIYFFHVNLFFLCSGYLYQRSSKVVNLEQWREMIRKKAMDILIPYTSFSVITWAMKKVMSSDVNTQTGGLVDSLLIHPISPYWYLYALFLLFMITPTLTKRNTVCVVAAASAMCVVSLFVYTEAECLNYIFQREIWFVSGMLLAEKDCVKRMGRACVVAGCAAWGGFLWISAVIYKTNAYFIGIGFLMSLMACAATLLVFAGAGNRLPESRVVRFTMPVFLMHTLFAAPIRIVLFRLGVSSPALHCILGYTASFIGPAIAYLVMEKMVVPEFLIYPRKVISKLRKG